MRSTSVKNIQTLIALGATLTLASCQSTERNEASRGMLGESEVQAVSTAVTDAINATGTITSPGHQNLSDVSTVDQTVNCAGGGTASVKGQADYSVFNTTTQASFDFTVSFAGCIIRVGAKNYTIESTGVRSIGGAQVTVLESGQTVLLDGSVQASVTGGVSVAGDSLSVGCDIDFTQNLTFAGPTDTLRTNASWQGSICGRDLSGSYSN